MLSHSLADLISIESLEEVVQVEREERYREKIIKSFFEMGKLKSIPVQNEKRKVILSEIAKGFEKGKEYTEKEVNIIIADYHDDFCTLRKYMVAEGILERKNSIYTVN